MSFSMLFYHYGRTHLANATNLTSILLYKYADSTNNTWGIQYKKVNGSINTLSNHNKIVSFWLPYDVTGNIQTTCVNMNKLTRFTAMYIYYYPQGSGSSWDTSRRSTDITGNISIFGNKYDLRILQFERYSTINGEIKDLKNLKKLYVVDFLHCSVTGSKTDLWNQGANVTTFRI